MVIVGSVKNLFFQKIFSHIAIMPSSLNINAGTVTPIVINPEAIPVDSDSEADLEEIQHEAAAEQKQIEEAAQAKLAAARERIERKQQEQKAKEEEARKAEETWKAEETRKAEETQKAEEEEERKWKEEEDKVVREKAQTRQLEVSSSTSLIFVGN